MASFVIPPPVEPMLAKSADAVPAGPFLYEPKWDGFRAIVFRGGPGEVYIQSRDLKPLDRYFPELQAAFLEALPDGCVIDGEIVIASPTGLDFDALQLRLHPAASRVAKLAAETPASFVAFDALAAGGTDLREQEQQRRREALEQLLRRPAIRRRRARRRRRQADGGGVSAGQARDDQNQALENRGLRGRRIPLAQEGRRVARRIAAARPV
jgi:ATP-dependent DNA ligase